MTRLAQGLFAALVLATFAAFFVAQRLKSSPPRIDVRGVDPVLSPNRDGRKDRGRIAFLLQRADSVDLAIVDEDGDVVRELVSGRSVQPRELVRAAWDGRDDAGRRAPDGTYRARITLRRQAQTVVAPRSIELDTTPPKPRVLSIGPETGKRPSLAARVEAESHNGLSVRRPLGPKSAPAPDDVFGIEPDFVPAPPTRAVRCTECPSVAVDDNANSGRASPVHHGDSIRRLSTARRARRTPRG